MTEPMVAKLEAEVAELRELVNKQAALLAGGVRTPNTDMIMGAALSGGDALKLAALLAGRVATCPE